MGRPRKQTQALRRGRTQVDSQASPSFPVEKPTLNDLISHAIEQVSSPILGVPDKVSPLVSPILGVNAAVSSPVVLPVIGDVPAPIVSPVIEEVSVPISIPLANSPIPNGNDDPIVIPRVHRPTWMDRVSNSPVGMELHHISDASREGEVTIEMADIHKEIEYWSNTLVVQFLGGKPSPVQV
ncbi:hypothetical protein RND81_09G088400 [Saponaria officinalis]|uniref:Uncharacterized protein n=1 Tax=Saponaria officinalis TaxID=3572 RepID=A0AAW1IJP1_SAPOF